MLHGEAEWQEEPAPGRSCTSRTGVGTESLWPVREAPWGLAFQKLQNSACSLQTIQMGEKKGGALDWTERGLLDTH